VIGVDFLIADTFTESLARLTEDERKATKTTAFDLQLNSGNPGMSFHKLDRAKDKNFWSVRVNDDIRLIVHRSEKSLLLCYVGHHDKAYDWAERRKVETHPKTGAAQLVEIRETVKEIVVPVYVQAKSESGKAEPARPIFASLSDEELLNLGVPDEWLEDVRNSTEDSLLGFADHLPAEAAEALLELATGGKPRVLKQPVAAASPFDHPDAKRRFRLVTDVEELKLALDYPWDRWTVFLHPDQREIVEREYAGPARVSGSAGTGKTVVALHRTVHLAKTNPDARVLLTTFSDTLANSLQTMLKRLVSNEPRLAERIEVYSLEAIALRLYKAHVGEPVIATRSVVSELISEAASVAGGIKFSPRFLSSEWDQVIDAWQLKDWESYRDVARLGRKTRLPEVQRKVLWSIFEQVLVQLKGRKLITSAEMFTSLATVISKKTVFDFVVVDEAQDISIANMRFVAALGADRPNGLFFAADLGQRIFQQPFSWKALDVDVRGRSRTLRVNYRTSHQIRAQADRLLGPELIDVDGNVEGRSDTVSLFNGPPPTIETLDSQEQEIESAAKWIADLTKTGVSPHEFGVFVRSERQLDRAKAAITQAGLPFKTLDEHLETTTGFASIGTMHLAKGLEFRAVAVMACDDEVIPLQERIEMVGDDADLKEVYDTERQLLYVACTRARDYLLVTGVRPGSEFLDDMKG
jgi:hypothetical protein